LNLQLPVQSVPIATKVVSLNPARDWVYSKQHYVIMLVSDLRQFSLGTSVSSKTFGIVKSSAYTVIHLFSWLIQSFELTGVKDLSLFRIIGGDGTQVFDIVRILY
jgi:hypothetical protein